MVTVNEKFINSLCKKSLLSDEDAKKYLKISIENLTPVYYELLKSNVLNEEILFKEIGEFYKIKFNKIEISELNFTIIDKFPRAKIIEHRIIPNGEDDKNLYCLLSDPLDIDYANEFKAIVNKNIVPILVCKSNMDKLIKFFDNKMQQIKVIEDFKEEQVNNSDKKAIKEVEIDAPIIKLCDSILKDAVNRGASDIHIEPFPDELLVRYRIDGKLVVIDHLKMSMYPAIVARYKIMSDLNIAERRIPQDGKINLTINNTKYDFRVSTLPTINGEKIVIRIFSAYLLTGDISTVGFNDKEKESVLKMITRPHGIILLTGPTGSGKTTTLYTFLRHLNNEKTNIVTVEDPVENQIHGINQVQVNAKANMTFASALRSILRQDPNVIMIGEIRDEETAQIATRAAITGHLVFSTLHTNSATGVVSRLVNMGVPPYLVADSLLGVISQRLVRKLCPHCKKVHQTNTTEMKMLGISKPKKIYQSVGCPTCNNTGYLGRTSVFEMMIVDEKVRDTIMQENFSTDLLNKALEKSMVTLIDNAREKVLAGVTSFEEFNELIGEVNKEN